MEEILKMKNELASDRPVRWDDLPDIDLYMDQVISYMPRQSTGGRDPGISSAMINNYVKAGVLPRATGKRYQKVHLAYLTAIGLLKSVLTVKNIRLILTASSLSQIDVNPDTYDGFLTLADEAFKQIEERIPEDLSEQELIGAALRMALISCAAKTACDGMLDIIREKMPEEQQKKEKNEKNEKKEKK